MNRFWLEQFTPVDESTLTAKQLARLTELREGFPRMKPGKDRTGRLRAFVIDLKAGPVAVDLD